MKRSSPKHKELRQIVLTNRPGQDSASYVALFGYFVGSVVRNVARYSLDHRAVYVLRWTVLLGPTICKTQF